MAYKFTHDNFYFIVTDTGTGEQEIREPRDMVKWVKTAAGVYSFYYNIPTLISQGKGEITLGATVTGFAFADIVDSAGAAFASQAILDTFLNTWTGSIQGSDVTISNSDDSYIQTVAAGTDVELTDVTIKVYLDGVLQSTSTIPAETNNTINITI
jgi:hypothetical protein